MKQITAYKTDDGSIFEIELEAYEHELLYLISDIFGEVVSDGDSLHELRNRLRNARLIDEFVKYLTIDSKE